MHGMLHVLLSLDLKNATEQRDDFYKKLAGIEFVKVRGVDTVWVRPMKITPSQETIDDLIRSMHTILKDTTERLEIEKISYVLQMGNTAPIGVVVEKVRGNYQVDEFDPAIKTD
jgi:hypothetical protein